MSLKPPTAPQTHWPTPQPRSPTASPEPQPRPGRTRPLAHLLSLPGRVPPLLRSQVSLHPTNQPQLRPGTVGIKMKAARFVMRSAGTLIPREVEHFSRYSPSPLSMKQLLDFGERGCRAREGLGSCLSFQTRYREDSLT